MISITTTYKTGIKHKGSASLRKFGYYKCGGLAYKFPCAKIAEYLCMSVNLKYKRTAQPKNGKI